TGAAPLTPPPPATPSTSTLSSVSCAFCSSFCAFCAICMIWSKSGISGMSAAFAWIFNELGVGKRLHHRTNVRIVQDIRSNLLLGDFFLIEQRWLAGFVGQRHLPARAGQRFERHRQLARPIAAQRTHRLQREFRRCVAHHADLVVELDGKAVLAVRLEQTDQSLKIW